MVVISIHNAIPSGESESKHNNLPMTMSDEQILEQIYSTHHVHSHDTKFDVHSLLAIVDNILTRSTHIVDSLLQSSQPNLERIEDRTPPDSNFASPLCTLRQICSELSCKPAGEETTHKTTLSILNKLSKYEWDAKAVITVAALAVEYGEFWLLAHHQPNDLLARSVGVLKRVSGLTKFSSIEEHRESILELNTLIKTVLQLIRLIFDLEKLSSKDVPALIPAIKEIPVNVYWTIITIAAIVTQTDLLITASDQRQDLSLYAHKINIVITKLKRHIAVITEQIAELNYINTLKRLLQTPTEILEVIKFLIFSSDAPREFYDGTSDSKTSVNIDVLRKKNVYLFISTLEITEEEISVLIKVQEFIKTREEYKIVWIPMVEEWTEEARKRLEIVKVKMPWYVVQHCGVIAGYRFIKEEWHFKKTPMVVVMNTQSMVLNTDAFHLIKVWGVKAFPFTEADRDRINNDINWFRPIIIDHLPILAPAIKEEKYILFYGGSKEEWVQHFTEYATTLVHDAALKEKKIIIELFCVEREEKSLVKQFWSGIESLFVTKLHTTLEEVTQEVEKVLSYKNGEGWALLTKGSTIVLSGYGNTMLKTVEEFDKWKELALEKGFEIAFTTYHTSIIKQIGRLCCTKIEIPNVAGKLPDTINCPCCPGAMDIFISYKCCHNSNSTTTVTSTTATVAKR